MIEKLFVSWLNHDCGSYPSYREYGNERITGRPSRIDSDTTKGRRCPPNGGIHEIGRRAQFQRLAFSRSGLGVPAGTVGDPNSSEDGILGKLNDVRIVLG